MPSLGRRSAYHHGDLKRALIDEALRLVAEQGLGALTLREAARRAGVSEAAPYRHFANKDALIAAVAEEGFRAMLRGVRRAVRRSPAGPIARLQALGAAYVRFAVDHPAHFRVMFGREVAASHGFKGLWDAAQANFAELEGAIGAAQAAGVLRGADPRRAARAAWAAVHGLAFLLVDGLLERQGLGPGRQGVEWLAREVTGVLFDGLRGPIAKHPARRRPATRRPRSAAGSG